MLGLRATPNALRQTQYDSPAVFRTARIDSPPGASGRQIAIDRDRDYRQAKSKSRVGSLWASDTLGSMELNVPPDLETKLARAANRRGMTPERLVLEAIERAVEYDDWFLREVEKGLAQVERGEVLTHDEVGARIERRLTHARLRP